MKPVTEAEYLARLSQTGADTEAPDDEAARARPGLAPGPVGPDRPGGVAAEATPERAWPVH